MANYYEILGLSRDSSDKEIRLAFRKLARKHHPDLNPGDENAEAEFKRINEAYEVLSDAENRKKYDLYGDRWKNAEQFQSPFGSGAGRTYEWSTGDLGGDGGFDLFGGLDDMLGGSGGTGGRSSRTTTRQRRLETDVDVTLEEAYAGTTRMVTITAGGKHRRIEVTIPPGVDNGSVVRVSLDESQLLLIKVSVTAHQRFERDGDNLQTEARVPYLDAILGGETEVQTLKGKVQLKIPPESQNGQKLRLAKQGMPKLGQPETKGDLYVTVRPTLPKSLTDEEKELLEQLKALGS